MVKNHNTPLKNKRKAMIDIILDSGLFVEVDKAPCTFTGTHVLNYSRVTLQLGGNNLKGWVGNFKGKSMLIRDVDIPAFKKYVYRIVGLNPPSDTQC
jgi:hypothetical protein